MAKYRVTAPDGSTYEISAPDGASEADVMAYAQSQFAQQVPSIEKPTAVKAGETIQGIPRQLGLTARYALEGPAQFLQIGTEPIRNILTALGMGKSKPLSAVASDVADRFGLPSPEGADERVVGDAARLVAGAGAAGAIAGVPISLGRLGTAVSPLANSPAMALFRNNVGGQVASAGGAGLAGGSVREAGGGPWSQAGASLLGGVAAPLGLSAATSAGRSAVNSGRSLIDSLRPIPQQTNQVDQQIALTLRQQGIDWSLVPERVKQPMRAEVSAALRTGDNLNPDALRRLLDFTRTNTTPTRGMLTQDPVQITREMNLAKTGANSTDIGLQRLPLLQSQNDQRLLSVLDDAGARGAPDNFAAGERGVSAVEGWIRGRKSNINDLYSAARDTQGRSVSLDGAAFTRRANEALAQQLAGKLPPQVEKAMNDIATGKTPLTVEYAEQLKTMLGNLQRSTSDGGERYSLGIVRRALDSAEPRSPQVNPGNLPAVPGTVPPSEATIGAESIQAFNRARQANRGLMQRVEQSPALKAVYESMQEGRTLDPDRFVQQFVTGQGASVADVRALQRSLAADPQAAQSLRQNVVAHLKNAATNNTEDITKFSPAGYNAALNRIGARKLEALGFSAEEIERLQAVGRASTLMKAQPTGTAVNNSNTGALLLGRAMSVLDTIAGKLPLGLDTTIQGVMRGVQQSNAMRVPPALLTPQPRQGLLTQLGMPAVYGGLLATQPIDQP